MPAIPRDADVGTPLSEMGRRLRARVAAGADIRPETREIWRQFQSIMGLTVAAETHRQVADDMFLFECWEKASEQGSAPNYVSFVRQISWADARGAFAGMTQLGCALNYDERLASQTLWSEGDADRWIRAVEASDVFQRMPRVARAVSVELADV